MDFKCSAHLWRNHESGKHLNVLRIHHTGQPGCFLYFRNPGGSGACTVNCDLLWFLSRPLLENWNALEKYGLIESGKEEML
mgnify:CR=1 FL=1